MRLIEDVPRELEQAEFGHTPSGSAVVWAFLMVVVAVVVGIVVLAIFVL